MKIFERIVAVTAIGGFIMSALATGELQVKIEGLEKRIEALELRQ